jgi:hypothetical protein
MSKMLSVLSMAFVGYVLGAGSCGAQVMQFSVYNNWWVDSDGNLDYNSSTIDESTCHNHSDYWVTVAIYTPDGRSTSSLASGLYSNTVSIPIDDVEGSYSLVTTGTYYCGCSFTNAGFGGGLSLPLKATVYTLYSSSPGGTACNGETTTICSYQINCANGNGSATCGSGIYSTYQWSVCSTQACPSNLKVYYWYRGGGVCSDVYLVTNPSNYNCS